MDRNQYGNIQFTREQHHEFTHCPGHSTAAAPYAGRFAASGPSVGADRIIVRRFRGTMDRNRGGLTASVRQTGAPQIMDANECHKGLGQPNRRDDNLHQAELR